MNDIGNFISTVGFPIAIATAFAYVIYKVGKKLIEKVFEIFSNMEATNKIVTATNEELSGNIKKATANNEELMNTIRVVTGTNKELAKTNSILASKIENKLDIVIERLDHK